ncbi:MAG: ferrous iron transport protein B [Desulfobulbaceae bacterium]|nr:ferrous iron transport protein B [Desulfobulbaceae bacterium]
MSSIINIALAGNPNAGKTTLFNHLTGSRQHVGNYPGVTVEKKEGTFFHNNRQMRITDLPGTYSLTAYSVEELVARDFLVTEKPDVVINIVDASNLERNMYLTTQFMELGVPLVIALNMVDLAARRGIEIDTEKLSELLKVPVFPIVARKGEGLDSLLETLVELHDAPPKVEPLSLSYGDDLNQALKDMTPQVREAGLLADIYPPAWTAMKILENDDQILKMAEEANSELTEDLTARAEAVAVHLQNTMDIYPEAVIADHRYGYIKSILRHKVIKQKFIADRLYTSDKIDKVVTHRILGPMIMVLVLLGIYSFTFSFSEYPVLWLEKLFGLFGSGVNHLLPDGPVKSMIIAGVIDGMGGVLGFVPIIMFMFFGIAILEDSGYLARVAFMMDRIFRIFGLHGSSVMPFIISGGIAGGCAVPGVMATRTLRSPKERMATLLTVPFMNCGAKMPVIALLIGAFFSDNKASYMFLATMAAWTVSLLAAKLLRTTVLKGESTPFVMELPPYRLPTMRGLLIHTWERTWQYMKKAGTVILGISILLWAMMTYPGLPEQEEARYDQLREAIVADYPGEMASPVLVELEKERAEKALRNSIAGRIGSTLEPVSSLAGFDWRTNIALAGGFAAKEVILSTLGTAYSLGDIEQKGSTSLKERLRNDPNWNPITAIAALAFIMFYAPCFVTLVCIAKESGSWKWAFFSMGFNTSIAFTLAVLIQQIGGLFAG